MGAFTFTVTLYCPDRTRAAHARGAVVARLATQLSDGMDCLHVGPLGEGWPGIVVYRDSDDAETPVRHSLGDEVPVAVFDNGTDDLSEPGFAAEWLACLTADADTLPQRLAAGLLAAACEELTARGHDPARVTADAERIRAEEFAEVLQAGGR